MKHKTYMFCMAQKRVLIKTVYSNKSDKLLKLEMNVQISN